MYHLVGAKYDKIVLDMEKDIPKLLFEFGISNLQPFCSNTILPNIDLRVILQFRNSTL